MGGGRSGQQQGRVGRGRAVYHLGGGKLGGGRSGQQQGRVGRGRAVYHLGGVNWEVDDQDNNKVG